MAGSRIGSAYVQLATTGFGRVMGDINSLAANIKALPDPKLNVTRLMEQADEIASALRTRLARADLRLSVKIDVENKRFLDELAAEIKGLPAEKRIRIIEEQIKTARASGGNAALVRGLQGMRTQETVLPGLPASITAAQSALTAFSGVLAGIQAKLQAVAAIGVRAFGGITAAILAGVAVGSPGHFEQLTYALKLVSAEIGLIFLPLIQQVTQWLLRLALFIDGLSDSQRKQIVWWTKATLAVAAFALVLPKILGALTAVINGFKLFLGALNFLLVSNPAGWVVIVVAALGALVVGLVTLVSAFTQTGKQASGFFGLMKRLFDIVAALVAPFVALVMRAFEELMDKLDAFGDTLREVVDEIMEVIGPGLAEFLALSLSAWGSFFAFILHGFEDLLKAVLTLGVLVKRALTLDFSGVFDEIDAVLSQFDKRLADRRAARLVQPDDEKIRPLPAYRPPTYSGIREASERIQQSVTLDPGEEARRRLNQQKVDLLKDIKTNTAKDSDPWTKRTVSNAALVGAAAGIALGAP